MSKFDSRVVLITGASAGIGAALAREFASEGANLVLLARRIEQLKAIADTIDPTGKRVLCLTCDVTQNGEVEKAVEFARTKFGNIDIAIANAGWSLKGNLEELSLSDYRRQWETNVFGVLRTIYATLADLKTTKGRLVIISSVKSYLAFPGDSPYSTSKFALRALCLSLSKELAPYGVSVTHVCPGYVATEIRRVDNRGVFQPDWSDPASPKLLKTPEQTAKEIVKAIDRRQTEQVLTLYGKLAVLMQRHFPWLLSWIISRWEIKVVAKKN
ncbi:MAG: SDR family NAD(P)-dependent oxidoreductase [Cyanosarcina radialis HA8281-LM2]|jgi:short-subunit dehydrogenase|nr:SDR family NAD(P)-dependent oxidoreductase [Cyanosarcina radialis HA8281-LM2]